MFKEFRDFIARGNVLDLAVAVLIGAAFGAIVTSFTDDILTPLIGAIFGSVDFSNVYVVLRSTPAYVPGMPYADAKSVASIIGIGAFISAIINFLIVAFALFLVVRVANRLQREKKEQDAPKADELTKDQQLLTEIRDALSRR